MTEEYRIRSEKGVVGKIEDSEQIKELMENVAVISNKLQLEGVPIRDDCRIDMNSFKGIYAPEKIDEDVKNAEGFIEEQKSLGKKFFPENKIGDERLANKGEDLELLSTAILNIFLGEDYIVARTSLYDDIKNKADIIILEKNTGNLICALDGVGETKEDVIYEAKRKEVVKRNKENNGCCLKYGIKTRKDKEGIARVELGRVEAVPIFYLALSHEHIREGIKAFNAYYITRSKYEREGAKAHLKNLFDYFIHSLKGQISLLKTEKLEDSLSKKVAIFEKSINNILEDK